MERDGENRKVGELYVCQLDQTNISTLNRCTQTYALLVLIVVHT